MISNKELIIMRAISICFKPYLKPEEAHIYCNLGRTQIIKKCKESGVYKNRSGYYKKEDLDQMLSGDETKLESTVNRIKV